MEQDLGQEGINIIRVGNSPGLDFRVTPADNLVTQGKPSNKAFRFIFIVFNKGACMYVHPGLVVPSEARKGNWISWSWNDRFVSHPSCLELN